MAGTKVLTDGGLENIEDIEAGDRVWSRDEFTREAAFKLVKSVVRTRPTELVHLNYRQRETSGRQRNAAASAEESSDSEGDPDPPDRLVGTANHRFWSLDRSNWVEMGGLRSGELLVLSDGSKAVVDSLAVEQAEPGQVFATYNLEVENWHSYHVAPRDSDEELSAVWVHNGGNPSCAASLPKTATPERTPIILGETMPTRVNPVAKKIGAGTFKPRSSNRDRWKPNQRRWIRRQIRDRRQFFDIGTDRLKTRRSPYYAIEKEELINAGYKREFRRWVSTNVDGERKKFRLYEWVKAGD